MDWFRVEHFNVDLDLSPLIQHLQANRVHFRVTDETQGQCLWVANQQHVDPVKQLISNIDFSSEVFQTPNTDSNIDVSGDMTRSLMGLSQNVSRYPITFIAIALGVMGYLSLEFEWFSFVSSLTFQPIEIVGNSVRMGTLEETLATHQYWRLLTPIFLHFGVMHVVFNSLWIWEFARRIELVKGPGVLLGLIVSIGVASNLGQYLWTGPSMFGGLSGVLYGLLGFIWVNQRNHPTGRLFVQPGIVVFLMIWLVIGITGAVNLFIDGSVANAAHVCGLLSGLLLGVFWRTPEKQQRI